MATSTLLEIVQDMLTALEAENVSAVGAGATTDEALMCVNIANRTFEALIGRFKWKHLRTYKALQAGSNNNELKGDTSDIYIDGHNVWYGSINEEQRIHYVDPEEFVRLTIGRTSTDSDVTVINDLKIFNDRDPSFYTSFNDEVLVFDSMPSGSGLVASDSKALVYVEPTTRLSTSAQVYDFPKPLFPYFRDLCIANALIELNGEESRGERLKREANKQIAKIATSGNFIDVRDNAYKNIITRAGSSGRRNTIVTS